VLATARHVSDNEYTTSAFKAVLPLTIVDTEPPTYKGENGAIIGYAKANLKDDGTPDGTYSGTFTIEFDKNIYRTETINGAKVRHEVWPVSTKTLESIIEGKNDDEKANIEARNVESIMNAIGGDMAVSAKLDIVEPKPDSMKESPAQNFTFQASELHGNEKVIFFSSGPVSNASGYEAGSKTLIITFYPHYDPVNSANVYISTDNDQAVFIAEWR
jgi:hypothetical protein